MLEFIRPVRLGIVIGLLGIVFGIGWAFWLVLGHERIHATLEAGVPVPVERGPAPAEARPHGHGNHSHPGDGHGHAAPTSVQHGDAHAHAGQVHRDAVMGLAHQRLTRGHLHAMGLGLASIIISVVIGLTSAPNGIKAAASTLGAVGGILYPMAWIVMGYRTPALGPELAEKSVVFMAGPGVALVLLGVVTALAFTVKDMFSAKKPGKEES
ncbi:hypothetical protein KJ039_06290 [bacterium]|nr:hypothetical protein [bacterium]